MPCGFAHGFQTLRDDTEVNYLVTQVFSEEHERGLLWNDAALGIEWPEANHRIISEKDRSWPAMALAMGHD